jgi:hypothetical protein
MRTRNLKGQHLHVNAIIHTYIVLSVGAGVPSWKMCVGGGGGGGGTKVIPHFFSETVITIINTLTYIIGTSFTTFGLFFHEFYFITNISRLPLRDTLNPCRVKLFAQESDLLHARRVFSWSSAKRCPRSSPFRRPRRWKSEGAKLLFKLH